MKIAAIALALGMLLCGCGAAERTDGAQMALNFRQKLLSGTCSFRAELRAEYEDTVSCFTLACMHSAEAGTSMTIIQPETLAGITAQVTGEEAKIVFEDTQAAFGSLQGLGASPMTAPQILANAWESGYIALTGMEDDMLRVTYLLGYDEEELTIDTWFLAGGPVRAEISSGGQKIIDAQIADFTIQEAKTDNEITQTDLGGYLPG